MPEHESRPNQSAADIAADDAATAPDAPSSSDPPQAAEAGAIASGEPTSASADELIERAAKLDDETAGDDDRRSNRRMPYKALVALVLIGPTGDKSRPLIIRAEDISTGGLRLASRQMFHVGSYGAALMRRSDGRQALVGVKVLRCTYSGKMIHHTGVQFIPLPREMSAQDFVDDHGRPVCLSEAETPRNAA